MLVTSYKKVISDGTDFYLANNNSGLLKLVFNSGTFDVTSIAFNNQSGTVPLALAFDGTTDGKFIASSSGLVYSGIATDSNWDIASPNLWFRDIISVGNHLYAVGTGIADSSNDGLTWTLQNPPNLILYPGNTNFYHSIVEGGGTLMAINSGNFDIMSDFNNTIITSADNGVTWLSRDATSVTGALASLAYGNGNFIISGSSGLLYISADDGASWSQVASANMTVSGTALNDTQMGKIMFTQIIYDGTNFIATGTDSEYSSVLLFTSSDDGVTWIGTDPVLPGAPTTLFYDSSNDKMFAGGGNGLIAERP